jgi:hypothetical protein
VLRVAQLNQLAPRNRGSGTDGRTIGEAQPQRVLRDAADGGGDAGAGAVYEVDPVLMGGRSSSDAINAAT